MNIKEKIKKFNDELKNFQKQYPTCKTWWNGKAKITEVYICDSEYDNPKVVGYIK